MDILASPGRENALELSLTFIAILLYFLQAVLCCTTALLDIC